MIRYLESPHLLTYHDLYRGYEYHSPAKSSERNSITSRSKGQVQLRITVPVSLLFFLKTRIKYTKSIARENVCGIIDDLVRGDFPDLIIKPAKNKSVDLPHLGALAHTRPAQGYWLLYHINIQLQTEEKKAMDVGMGVNYDQLLTKAFTTRLMDFLNVYSKLFSLRINK